MLSAEMTNKVIDDPLKKILGEQSFDISVGIASLRMGIMSWNPEHAITSLKHNEKNENLRAQAYKKHVTKQSFVHIFDWMLAGISGIFCYLAIFYGSESITNPIYILILAAFLVWVFNKIKVAYWLYREFEMKMNYHFNYAGSKPEGVNLESFKEYLNAYPDLKQIANWIKKIEDFQYSDYALFIICRRYIDDQDAKVMQRVEQLLRG